MPIVDLRGITCIQYLRVSTERQAGEKQTSLADQANANARLAAQLGVVIGQTFQDAGLSGATIEQRPGLQSLVASCDASPRTSRAPGYVLVLNDSRFGRFADSEDATYWRGHLRHRGWLVRFAEHDDVQDDLMRPMMRTIGQTQATLYRKNLQANVKRGARGTAGQGYWMTQAPFGYRRKVVYPVGRERILERGVLKASDEKIVLVPHAEESQIVRQIFALYTSGQHSIESVTEWAIATWPQRQWNRPTIRNVLTNPAYMGDVVWGRTPADDSERALHFTRPATEWYGKQDAHEAIVTRSVFAQAQYRLQMNRRRTRGVRSDWVLSGIVRCRCGKSMASGGGSLRRADGSRARSYRCATLGGHPSGKCPYRGTVLKEWLEDAVLGVLADVLSSTLHRKQMGTAIDGALRATKQAARTLVTVDADLASVKAKQQRLVAAIEADTVSSIEARDRMNTLRAEVLRLTAERETLAARLTRPLVASEERERLIALAMDFRTTAKRLSGPALRELIRPWIKTAVFNTETRMLTIEIRRVPMADISIDSEAQPSGTKARPELVTTRTVLVRRRVS